VGGRERKGGGGEGGRGRSLVDRARMYVIASARSVYMRAIYIYIYIYIYIKRDSEALTVVLVERRPDLPRLEQRVAVVLEGLPMM
jgi:hypothetical protein